MGVRSLLLVSVVLVGAASTAVAADSERRVTFHPSGRCVACHNGMPRPSGGTLDIGDDWRVSLMANSARDPYWQASVRREVLDHPESRSQIEDECAACHMPLARQEAKLRGRRGEVFANLEGVAQTVLQQQARDGVSCSLCHQIAAQELGDPSTFNGEFHVDSADARAVRREFGPYDVEPSIKRVMRSSTQSFEPAQAPHVRDSALCASCHTLTTQALGNAGSVLGTLHEQAPYQEWQNSAYAQERSCQSCHMPSVNEPVAISRVLGEPRTGAARHVFVAANFLMQKILGRFGPELGTTAPATEFDAAAVRTLDFLKDSAASLRVTPLASRTGRISFAVDVINKGGHRLPTGYPARRVWLHVRITNPQGDTLFESGALRPDGSIEGDDNDADARRFEPHYREIHDAEQVQIYESVLGDADGLPTTGLLSGVRYLKDNRLLPHGFDKQRAPTNVAVVGDALLDPDFDDRADRITYEIDSASSRGPFSVEVELLYQPIGYRWATNLGAYDAPEPRRFSDYYRAMQLQHTASLAALHLEFP